MSEHRQVESLPYRPFVIGFASYALLGGLVTLAGWCGRLPRLTDWVASGISMLPNTAIAAVCCAAALLLGLSQRAWGRQASVVLGLLVMLTGGTALFEHLSGRDLGIDSLFMDPAWGSRATVAPGRMGPPGATSFLLLGLGLMLAGRPSRARRLSPGLGLGVSAIAMLSVTGYVFGTDPLYAVARFTGIAMQTATMLLALGLGLVASVPDCEPGQTWFRDSAAGLLARRSLPFIIILPLGLGWLRVLGQKAGYFDTGMGTALLTLTLSLIFCGLLWWCIRAVTQREEALWRNEEELRQAQRKLELHAAQLESTVAERTARLTESVNELQSLSYSIAHDMRAPLRAMGTFAQLLQEEGSRLSPAAKDYCQRILTGAARLDALIQDALNYTKATLQEFPAQPVDLSELVPGLLQTYPNLQRDQADIQVEGTLPVVLGNDALLTQCFSNLLGNAVKFVAPGTRPQVRIRAERTNDVARVWVEDNGIGIPRHAQARVFGMFQRLDGRYEGTGIGLAIVRKVVERMRGKVGVESEAGIGSRFWVELPVAPEEAAA